MNEEEIINKINHITGLQAMTVNERLYVSGLWDSFYKAKIKDKAKAKKILEWLKVDHASIEKIIS